MKWKIGSWNENDEVNDSRIPIDVSIAFNINNLGVDVILDDGQETPHLDIYDPRNWENLITNGKIF